jgi:hypothetical protein
MGIPSAKAALQRATAYRFDYKGRSDPVLFARALAELKS